MLAIALLLPLVLSLTAQLNTKFAARLSSCVPPAAMEQMKAPYDSKHEYWEAVLALQRLAIVVVQTFSANSALAAVLQVVVCVIALTVHISYRPFRIAATNHVQTALLGSLVVVVLLNVPHQIIAMNATSESAQARLLIGQLESAENVVLMLPALVCAVLGVCTVIDYARRGQVDGKGEASPSASRRARNSVLDNELLVDFAEQCVTEAGPEAGASFDERQSLSEPLLQGK